MKDSLGTTDTAGQAPRTWLHRFVRLFCDTWEDRRYLWRLHLGWLPVQPCMMCDRWFWGGLPRWWWMGEDGNWGMTWQASWCDHCSRECADEDLKMVEEYQIAEYGCARKRVSFELPGGGVGAITVNCDITADELEAIRQLMIAAAAGYEDEANIQGQPRRAVDVATGED